MTIPTEDPAVLSWNDVTRCLKSFIRIRTLDFPRKRFRLPCCRKLQPVSPRCFPGLTSLRERLSYCTAQSSKGAMRVLCSMNDPPQQVLRLYRRKALRVLSRVWVYSSSSERVQIHLLNQSNALHVKTWVLFSIKTDTPNSPRILVLSFRIFSDLL